MERDVHSAAELCQITGAVPEELRACKRELDRESTQAGAAPADEENGNKIVQCIDRLEKLGDRALRSCEQADNLDPGVASAVRQAHER